MKRAVLGLAGVTYLASGAALLGAPRWFFDSFAGDFPPYNRHFEGDVGAFLLALGAGLLLATRDPAGHRLLIGVGALGSLIHAGNHAYDAVSAGAGIDRWVGDVGIHLVIGVALAAVALVAAPREAPG